MKKFLYKLVELLTPSVRMGGLEISDSAIRFLQVNKGNKVVRQESLRLPAGIIENGRVKNEAALVEALTKLKQSLEPKKNEPVHVVLSFTSAHVYAQSIFLPQVAEQNLDEAAKLNMEMISPIRLQYAYYDWQSIKRKEEVTTNKVEIFTAVINKDVVDDLSRPLKEAGFVVVAADFAAMSLGRIVKELKTDAGKHKPEMMLFINSDGIELFIMHAGELYFNYYESWEAIRGKGGYISQSAFRDHIVNAIVRLKNYYQTRFNVELNDLLVIAPGLYDQVERAVSEREGLIRIKQFEIEEFDFPRYWCVALGAALRARKPRYLDHELSLSGLSTGEEYSLIRGTAFVRLWRNLSWTSFLFLVILFGSISIFLVRYESSLELISPEKAQNQVDVAVLRTLQEEAQEFNRLVTYAQKIQDSLVEWPPLVRRVERLLGEGISLSELKVSENFSATLDASAPSGEAALAFRDRLLEEPGIEEVKLPVESLIGRGEGRVEFTVTFRVTDMDYFAELEEKEEGVDAGSGELIGSDNDVSTSTATTTDE